MRVAALELEGATEDLERAMALHASDPEERFLDDVVSTQALLAYRRGDAETAERLAHRGIEGAGERAYAGGFQLGVATLALSDPGDRRRAFELGSEFVKRPSISHGILLFHRYALEAALLLGDRAVAQAQITALREYTAAEPIVWADLVIENGELFLHPDPKRIDDHILRAYGHNMRDLMSLPQGLT
jgi:hypothetical protein